LAQQEETEPSELAQADAARPVEVAKPYRRWTIMAATACVAGFLGMGSADLHGDGNALESFWNPVWGSSETVMMALGTPGDPAFRTRAARDGEIGPSILDVIRNDRVAFSDALTMSRLTGVIREYGKRMPDVRRAPAISLNDLRTEPAILIGAFNNPWTMRLNTGLRYIYEWDEQTHTGMIRDRQNSSNRSWIHDPNIPYSKLTQDYALVSRFQEPLTEEMTVVVAGLGRDGTIAAGEFVTDPHYLQMLAARAPSHWARKNLQVLLSTDVVDGKPGPPRIVTTYFW
jgi:hypothetical protein